MTRPVGWLAGYDRAYLPKDAVAGLTVWALLVPQALAYSQLAGLPPVHGLHAALGGLALYGVFGTSRHLNVGPEATIATLVGIEVATSDYHTKVGAVVRNLDQINRWDTAVGVATIASLLLLRWLVPKVPAYLVAVALAVLATALFDLDGRGVSVVSDIE